jgi:hypothetical protein
MAIARPDATSRAGTNGLHGPLAAGLYFVRCEAGGQVASRRFAVVR